MLGRLFPHGSRRRAYAANTVLRVKHSRKIRYHKRSYNDLRQEYYRNKIRTYVSNDNAPLISIIVPCFNTPENYLRPLIDSVFSQGYSNWELVLIDASSDSESSKRIASVAESDTRVTYKKIKNEGIALNTNIGIEIARGPYIAFLDHDDTLDPDALAENAKVILACSPDLIYSDEDKVSDDGAQFFEPHYKPDFSLPLLRCVNYITHFVVVKKAVAQKVGYIEAGYDGAQDYNFLLQVADVTENIYHIPKILYHWRQAVNSTASNFANKRHVTDAGERAVSLHYKRRGINGVARAINNRPGFYETKFTLPEAKRAVIINLGDATTKEYDFIRSAYLKHRDVKQYGIDVIVGDNQRAIDYDEVIYITRPIVPTHPKDWSVSALFGNLHAGAVVTTVRTISRGRILSCGLVRERNGLMVPLYHGMDVTLPQYFGSPEWNRRVDGVLWGVVCAAGPFIAHADVTKPLVVDNLYCIGQYDYLEMQNCNVEIEGDSQASNFNSNLSFEMYPRLITSEAVQEKIEINE